MAIPTAFDAVLAKIDNAAASVRVTLTVMHFCGRGDPKALKTYRRQLRERLQHFVDIVMDMAPDAEG
jgi:hypothetical protein